MDKITVDTIIDFMKVAVENKKAIFDTEFWLDCASKLNLLIADEHDKLFDLQQKVAQIRSNSILSGQTSTAARIVSEASDIYRRMVGQKAKVGRCEEFIRIAKIRARISGGNY